MVETRRLLEQEGVAVTGVDTVATPVATLLGDTVAFLAAGRVIESAPPAEWFERPATEQARRFLSRVLRYS